MAESDRSRLAISTPARGSSSATAEGPTELAICTLLDFFEVYEQAPDLPVNFYGFRETFIAPPNHDAERLEIEGSALVAWMDAERRREIRPAWRRRHVRWSLRRRHRPRRR